MNRFQVLDRLAAAPRLMPHAFPVFGPEPKTAFIHNFALCIDRPSNTGTVAALPDIGVHPAGRLRHALAILGPANRKHWTQIKKNLEGTSVLMIANGNGMGRNGSGISLGMGEGRILFDVDMRAVRQAKPMPGSTLPRLAGASR